MVWERTYNPIKNLELLENGSALSFKEELGVSVFDVL